VIQRFREDQDGFLVRFVSTVQARFVVMPVPADAKPVAICDRAAFAGL
jgi:hypothetical protein